MINVKYFEEKKNNKTTLFWHKKALATSAKFSTNNFFVEMDKMRGYKIKILKFLPF